MHNRKSKDQLPADFKLTDTVFNDIQNGVLNDVVEYEEYSLNEVDKIACYPVNGFYHLYSPNTIDVLSNGKNSFTCPLTREMIRVQDVFTVKPELLTNFVKQAKAEPHAAEVVAEKNQENVELESKKVANVSPAKPEPVQVKAETKTNHHVRLRMQASQKQADQRQAEKDWYKTSFAKRNFEESISPSAPKPKSLSRQYTIGRQHAFANSTYRKPASMTDNAFYTPEMKTLIMIMTIKQQPMVMQRMIMLMVLTEMLKNSKDMKVSMDKTDTSLDTHHAPTRPRMR